MKTTMWTYSAPLLALHLFCGAGAMAAEAPPAPTPARDQQWCQGFHDKPLTFKDRSVRVVSSQFVEAGPLTIEASAAGPAHAVAAPAHCDVYGVLQERTGVNNNKFAIRFHMRLPVNWNHRFFFQGGGGSNGEVGNATGFVHPSLPPALAQGYAVLSQDSGHDNATNTDPRFNGQLAFAFDPEARSNYGHRSLKATAQVGKEILKHYYGDKPRHSYFVACSKGGQEGMMFAQRYPEEFDGIVTAAPGFSLPRAAVAEAWDVQVFGALVKQPGARNFDVKDLHKAFSDADLALARGAILEACDADDGLKDGIVGDTLRCTDSKVVPQLKAKLCKGEKAEGCLSQAQIDALVRSRHGPSDSQGKALYADWPWASGMASQAWRVWKIGFPGFTALNVTLGGSSLSAMFTTPPTAVGDSPQVLADYLNGFDFDRDAAKIYATDKRFTSSAWQDVGARSPDLSAFRKRGGRLIVPHGDSDPVFSLNDTLNWYREVDARFKGRADSFVRVFPVPGMCHCGQGPATDTYDVLTAIVAWVEEGKAPDHLLATAGPASPWPGRERPVCAYPKVARYVGKGDTEKASSFSCKV